MLRTKELTEIIKSILQNLPIINQLAPTETDLAIQKSVDKMRFLETKLKLGRAGKSDKPESRAAICLEHVVRRELECLNSIRIPKKHLAEAVRMKEKEFGEFQDRISHYLDDNRNCSNVYDGSDDGDGASFTFSGRSRAISNRSCPILKNDLDRYLTFMEKLRIKIDVDTYDTERASQNAAQLLKEIHHHLKSEKVINIRNAGLSDFDRHVETYAAVCFYLECIHSESGKNRKILLKKNREELYSAVLTAVKSSQNNFDKVFKHVNQLRSEVTTSRNHPSKAHNQKIMNMMNITRDRYNKKRKYSSTLQRNANDAVTKIMDQSLLSNTINECNETEPNEICPIPSSDSNDFSSENKKTTKFLPPLHIRLSRFIETHGDTSNTDTVTSEAFRKWKHQILQDAKKHAIQWVQAKNERECSNNDEYETNRIQELSDREALSIAANESL